MNTPENTKKKKDKPLPWWVELFFVQIGLPDKLLIKLLKTKKRSKELLKNNKELVFTFFFMIAFLWLGLCVADGFKGERKLRPFFESKLNLYSFFSSLAILLLL